MQCAGWTPGPVARSTSEFLRIPTCSTGVMCSMSHTKRCPPFSSRVQSMLLTWRGVVFLSRRTSSTLHAASASPSLTLRSAPAPTAPFGGRQFVATTGSARCGTARRRLQGASAICASAGILSSCKLASLRGPYVPTSIAHAANAHFLALRSQKGRNPLRCVIFTAVNAAASRFPSFGMHK